MKHENINVIVGIDTHADTHHVALITEFGKHLADKKFLAVGSGYREIAEYITQCGPVVAVGIEGTGSYGAELTRVLTQDGFTVALTGVAPIPASSGKTSRHRLSRDGERAANASIPRIVLVRMAKDQRTRDYVAKRTAESKGKLEIMRCLKRYVAREIYRVLQNPRPALLTNDLRPRRLALHLTQTAIAQELGAWPKAISRIERGRTQDRNLSERYRTLLDEQARVSA